MRLALVELQYELDFEWIETDIDRDTELIRLYDSKVPVLEYQEKEVCHYFIDDKAIRKLCNKKITRRTQNTRSGYS